MPPIDTVGKSQFALLIPQFVSNQLILVNKDKYRFSDWLENVDNDVTIFY